MNFTDSLLIVLIAYLLLNLSKASETTPLAPFPIYSLDIVYLLERGE